MSGAGGGSANAAEGQNQADQMRLNPGSMGRWPRGEWRRFLIAAIPFIVVIIIAFLVSR